MKLKQDQFYCVGQRKVVTLPREDIKVRKVTSARNGVRNYQAYGYSKKLGCKVTRFVTEKQAQSYM